MACELTGFGEFDVIRVHEQVAIRDAMFFSRGDDQFPSDLLDCQHRRNALPYPRIQLTRRAGGYDRQRYDHLPRLLPRRSAARKMRIMWLGASGIRSSGGAAPDNNPDTRNR